MPRYSGVCQGADTPFPAKKEFPVLFRFFLYKTFTFILTFLATAFTLYKKPTTKADHETKTDPKPAKGAGFFKTPGKGNRQPPNPADGRGRTFHQPCSGGTDLEIP